MTVKEIYDKIGAMHLRFQDEEDNYVQLMNLLMEYQEHSDQYGLMVSAALKDGLKNYERYLKLDSALSPRSIIIEKKGDPATKKVKKSDAEGYYRVAFIMDDGSLTLKDNLCARPCLSTDWNLRYRDALETLKRRAEERQYGLGRLTAELHQMLLDGYTTSDFARSHKLTESQMKRLFAILHEAAASSLLTMAA